MHEQIMVNVYTYFAEYTHVHRGNSTTTAHISYIYTHACNDNGECMHVFRRMHACISDIHLHAFTQLYAFTQHIG